MIGARQMVVGTAGSSEMRVMRRLWRDEAGFVVSTELVLVATIVVIGLIVGLTSIRDQVVQELGDIAAMISQLNQSYSFSAITGHHSTTGGSFGNDQADSCDTFDPICQQVEICIDVCGVDASPEG